MSKPKTDQVTVAIIEAWKKEHGSVSKFTSTDGKIGYFKSPDIKTMEASMVLAASNPIQSNKVLAKNCFLGGDEEVYEDPAHLYGLGKHLKSLIKTVEGELIEL